MGRSLTPTSLTAEVELSSSSGEDDVGIKALRFHVHTRRNDSLEGPSRLQHVVDKPVAWGPDVMPLRKIFYDTETKRKPVERICIPGARDCFELKGILTDAECKRLVESAEALGFEYWGKEAISSDSSDSSRDSNSTISSRVNNDYRSAHTLEVEHAELAELIWVRMPCLFESDRHLQ